MAPSDQPPHPQGFQPAVKPSQNAWEKKLSFGTVAAKDTAPLQAGQKPESSVSAAETVVEPRPSTGPVPSSSGKQMQQDGARPAPASATNQTVPVQMPPSVKGRDMSSTTEPATTKITFGSAYVGSPQRPSSVPVAAAGAQPTMSYASIALKNAPPQTTADGKQLPVGISTSAPDPPQSQSAGGGKVRFGNGNNSGVDNETSGTTGSGNNRRQSHYNNNGGGRGGYHRRDHQYYQQTSSQRYRQAPSEFSEEQQPHEYEEYTGQQRPYYQHVHHPSYPPQQQQRPPTGQQQQGFMNAAALNPAASSFAPTPSGYIMPQMSYYAYMPYAPVQYAPPPNYATGFVPHGYPAPPQQQQLNTAVPSHALNGPDGTQPATTSSGVEQELQPLPTGVATAKTVPSQPQQQQSQDAAAATLPQNTNLTAAVPPKIQITQPVPTIITMGMPFIPGIPPSTQQQQQQQQQQPKPTEPLFKKATARVQIKLVNPDTNEEIKLAKPQPVAASPTANDKPEDKKPAATKETPATTEAKPAATAAPTKEIPKVAAAPVKEAPKSAAIEIKAAPPAAPSKAIPIEKPPVTAEQPAKPVEVKITEPPKQQQKPKEEPAAKPAPVTAAAEKPAVSAPKEQLKVTTAQEPLLPPPSKDEPKQRSRSPSPPKQTAPQKKTYTKEFLLSLREQCRERPLDMKMIEVVIGVTDESGGYGGSRRNSRRSGDRASDASFASVGGSGRYGSGRGSAALDGSAPSTRGGPRGSAGVSRQSSGPGKYPPAPSGGRGGSSRRGRGGRGGAPTEREREPPAPAIVLPKSENRWVPKSIAAAAVGAAAALAEESEDEKLYRKASGLLNKLTPEKFDKIVGQLLELPITSQKLNEGMMRVIFEKALDEPKFSSLYAGVCVRFVTNPPKFDINDPNARFPNDLFRRCLVKACEEEYRNENRWADTVDMSIPIDRLTPEQLAERTLAEANRRKMKRRTLGNIRFIGELFKLNMLTEKLMWGCVLRLVGVDSNGAVDDQKDQERPEEEYECLCDLLETIGERLDHKAAAMQIQFLFERLKSFSENQLINSRIRFKILDVIDLRKRGWKARERQQIMNAGPMTISEIHKLAAEKERLAKETVRQRERERKEQQQRKPSGTSGNASEWKTEQSRSILKRDGPGKPASAKEREAVAAAVTTDKPGLTASSAGRGGSTEAGLAGSRSASQDQLDSGNRGNMFQALMMDTVEDSTHSAGVGDLPKQLMERVEFEKYFPKKFSAEFALSLEEGVESGYSCLLKLRTFVKDEEMQEKTAEALKRLLDDYCKPALHLEKEESFKKVEAFANVVAMLFQTQLIPLDDLKEILTQQLTYMPDMVVDAPGLPYLLAVVCAVCILNEEFDLQFVRNQIFNSVEDLGDFTPFVKPNSTQLLKPPAFAELLAVLLSTIQRLDGEDGDMAAAEIWRRYCSESGDRDGNENEIDLFKYPWWGTDRKRLQAIPSEAVLQWLDKHALRELLLPSTAAADDEAPMNPDFEPQLKQLIADGVELGALRSYLSEQPSMDADQISLLTDNILRQSDCLAKYASVLKPYFNKVDNQIQLIYRVQDVGHSAPYKSDGKFFHKVFEKLYDEQVVSEEAFKAWEADSSHHLDKKGTTMARGGQTFLSWLKTAEAE